MLTEARKHELAFSSLPDENKETDRETEAADFEVRGEVVEKILEANYVFADDDLPVSQYANSRIKELFPEENMKVRIAMGEDVPNALSLSNGTIVITEGMLDLVSTQDELDFVLAHEGVHYTEKHLQQQEQIERKIKKMK